MNFSSVFNGRMGRRAFALFNAASVAALLALFVVERSIILFVYPTGEEGGFRNLLDIVLLMLSVSQWLLVIFVALALVVLNVRRLHDVGYSGLCVLPIIALVILSPVSVLAGAVALLGQFLLMIAYGDKGRNRFGEPPSASVVGAERRWR